jgi:hypothetical protein
MQELTRYCAERIDPAHWLGMMQTTWERIDKDWMHVHEKAVNAIKESREIYESL